MSDACEHLKLLNQVTLEGGKKQKTKQKNALHPSRLQTESQHLYH